eukprot:8618203-Alexandrium_andersonii.AAC.1
MAHIVLFGVTKQHLGSKNAHAVKHPHILLAHADKHLGSKEELRKDERLNKLALHLTSEVPVRDHTLGNPEQGLPGKSGAQSNLALASSPYVQPRTKPLDGTSN